MLKNKLIKLKKKECWTLWLSHGTCSCFPMYINAVADSVMLYLQHDFYNITFKIKHNLFIASGVCAPPPPSEKIWVRTWMKCHYMFYCYHDKKDTETLHQRYILSLFSQTSGTLLRAEKIYISSSPKVLDFDFYIYSLAQPDTNKMQGIKSRLQAEHLTSLLWLIHHLGKYYPVMYLMPNAVELLQVYATIVIPPFQSFTYYY
jgi:hypothetical protein